MLRPTVTVSDHLVIHTCHSLQVPAENGRGREKVHVKT